VNGLLERLAAGPVICAEGYLFELERRGYVQAGPFVPEVVLEHPDEVLALHRAFVRAGSDVVEAFTYYAHREKLRAIGREESLEELNRRALELAATVARETGTLLAGNICNTNIFDPAEPATRAAVREIFVEQIGWAVEAGADFIVAETIPWLEEAEIALDAIRAAGLPSVVTLAAFREPQTLDAVPIAEACARLADRGADVVGLNCIRGPGTMLPLLSEIVARTDAYVAALPVPYRTTANEPGFTALTDAAGQRAFPTALDPFLCNRSEIADFARAAVELGVRYLGLCCGAGPHTIRALAEAIGRTPEASRYSPDMSMHAILGERGATRSPRIADRLD